MVFQDATVRLNYSEATIWVQRLCGEVLSQFLDAYGVTGRHGAFGGKTYVTPSLGTRHLSNTNAYRIISIYKHVLVLLSQVQEILYGFPATFLMRLKKP